MEEFVTAYDVDFSGRKTFFFINGFQQGIYWTLSSQKAK